MSSIVVINEKARNTFSLRKYKKNFDNLDWRQKKVVNNEIPLLLLSEIID